MQYRMVFDLGGDDMVAPFPVRKRHSLDRPVIRLAPARSKINLVGSAPSAFARLDSCVIDCLLRFTGNAVDG